MKDEEYFRLCKKEAKNSKNIHFLGYIPHNSTLFLSAYAACKVFVLPSWYETPGLAALEAGLAGANVVITQRGATKEYFKKYAWYVDPSSVKSIREKTLEAFYAKKSKKLSKHILKNYTWEKGACQLKL